MTTTTEFQLVDINKLVPYANNARTHNKEQILKLRSSLREFGATPHNHRLQAKSTQPKS